MWWSGRISGMRSRRVERIDVPRRLVLNGVGRQHTGYYYGSGYYYYHSSYGRDAAAEKSGEKRAAS